MSENYAEIVYINTQYQGVFVWINEDLIDVLVYAYTARESVTHRSVSANSKLNKLVPNVRRLQTADQ